LDFMTLAVGGSFTVEPLRSPLQHWMSFLGITTQQAYIPYGQMLLHLVDPNSSWNQNQKGANILLVRPSDFLREGRNPTELSYAIDEFWNALKIAQSQWKVRSLIVLAATPISTRLAVPTQPWTEIEFSLAAKIQTLPSTELLLAREIFENYQISTPTDDYLESVGHVPWNDPGWTAIATAIARRIDAATRPPIKVIVADCDHTLWNGVCGEDGPLGIKVEPGNTKLQLQLLQQRNNGRLLALCSKNSVDDVWSVFDQNSHMLLRRDHITSAFINWEPKSKNLRELSHQLNLAPDSFLFLDDNPLEIEEVQAHLPDVHAIRLPSSSSSALETFLDHLWLFDSAAQTDEDQKRAQMYTDESIRQSFKRQSSSLRHFLESLDIRVEIKPLTAEDRARAEQLLQRTNQFNFNPALRSLQQLDSLGIEHELEILTVRTQDRFGDYGLVGLMAFHCEGATLHLDQMVLSCRALGRTVEIRMLQHLAQLGFERLKQQLNVHFTASSRNTPAVGFLNQLHSTLNGAEGPHFAFAIDSLLSMDPLAAATLDEAQVTAPTPPTEQTANLRNRVDYQRIAELNSADAIHTFLKQQFSRVIERRDGFEPPSTDLEKSLCAICQDILFVNDISLLDSFRDLGCTSLGFVRICAQIKRAFDISIPITEAFALGTLRDLVDKVEAYRLMRSTKPLTTSVTTQRVALREKEHEPIAAATGNEIAIIGMAGRFPGAENVTAFWNNLCQGIESIETLSDAELNLPPNSPLRSNPNLVRRASYVANADHFDAKFFGVFPKEAASMDPQHRLLLEECYHALEDAGYVPDRIVDPVGVFAGCYMDTYVLSCLETHPEWIQGLANSFHGGDLLTELGNDKDYLATRISFLLNLRGPALTIQTACSTSLVAVIQACQSLLSGQCRMALAGGVTLKFPQKRGYLYTEGGMVSPEGKCRTFDAKAKGTIFGEGVAVVTLKTLSHALADGDSIYAVLKGWGINNDGRSKAGYTAPSIVGQSEAIVLAHRHAGITADTISYIEAHGTGTSLGDPIEIEALTRAFRQTTTATGFCRIGSAKTNIGHLDVAAGACGLIKASLALEQELIPPTLNYDTPNPNIDFSKSPFVVNTTCTAWPRTDTPRRAGLSSFGVGGTNAHVIVEEAPQQISTPSQKNCFLLSLSARSETALVEMKRSLSVWLEQHPNSSLADVAYTLAIGRKKFNYTWSAVVEDKLAAIAALKRPPSTGSIGHSNRRNVPVAFAFPGQGSQHARMGWELYCQEPVFADVVDRCSRALEPHLGFSLRDALYSDEATRLKLNLPDINQTVVAQPGIFVTSYATATWLQSLGIEPAIMIGHSVGEFVAACLAGVFSLDDALHIIAFRAKTMQQLPAGHMLAVRLGEEKLGQSSAYRQASAQVSLAATNSPQLSVVSGEIDAITQLQQNLNAEGIVSKILQTSHAFHSWMMEPAIEPLAQLLKKIQLAPPNQSIISTVTGQRLTDEQATAPDYWARHLRDTVRFSDAAMHLLSQDYPVVVELGPGQTLSTLLKQHAGSQAKSIIPFFSHPQQEINSYQHALVALGKTWQAGADFALQNLWSNEKRQRVHLPGYPFERQRYWFDQLVHSSAPTANSDSTIKTVENSEPTTDSAHPQPPEASSPPALDGANATHASNDDYAAVVQRVIRQQLELMSQQLKIWHP
jgi:FkbH-like protein